MNLKDIREFNKFFVFLLLLIALMVIVLGKNIDFYYSEGVMAFNTGNYQKAEKFLKMALLLQPSLENTSNIKYMIGLSALHIGDLVTARAYLPGKNFSHTNNASINQVSRRDLLKNIVQWETLSNPIKKDNVKRKTIPLWVGFLIFFSIFSVIMLTFFLYKHKKMRKPFRTSPPIATGDEATLEDIETFAKSETPSPMDISVEKPSDMPSEEEIRTKLENLLEESKGPKTEKVQTKIIEEPEKIVQTVNDDASDNELVDLTKAVQEILSKESENSKT